MKKLKKMNLFSEMFKDNIINPKHNYVIKESDDAYMLVNYPSSYDYESYEYMSGIFET